jgi:HPr kinase/phosphorylase
MNGARGKGIHATAVVYTGVGILIRGPSGSGKSALALALIARARDIGGFGALVGDDRIWARAAGGRLVASGSPLLAGLIERRGIGLIGTPHEASCVIELVVELSTREGFPPRLPSEPDVAMVEGVHLPRLVQDSACSVSDRVLAVDERIRMMPAFRAKQKGISLEHCTAVHKNDPLAGAPEA